MGIVGKIGAILRSDTNPEVGLAAPETSLAEYNGDIYYKNGALDTDWMPVNGGSGTPQVELRIITAQEALDQQIELNDTPNSPSQVTLIVRNAPGTFYGDDFIVSGNILSWSGLALSGLISEGDKFTISYWV